MNNTPCSNIGFTLIELLIVVAIIAILAAIAVPNFLEAQIRAKVGRARSDLRTIATGLESYAVDNNNYPPNYNIRSNDKTTGASIIPPELSTPVAYLSTSMYRDPFGVTIEGLSKFKDLVYYYTYHKIVKIEEARIDATSNRSAANAAIDDFQFNYGALQKYGKWALVSKGPDRKYPVDNTTKFSAPLDILYDSTNGTVSVGNIVRTQISTEGIRP